MVAVGITPQVAPEGGGTILVTVTNRSDSLIDELVLRWPTELAETLFLVALGSVVAAWLGWKLHLACD